MRLVYIAGAYTARHAYQVKRNIIKADLLAIEVELLGLDLFPCVPHTNTSHHEGTRDGDYFIEGTLEWMRRCDTVLVVPGYEASKGTKGEIEEAMKMFAEAEKINPGLDGIQKAMPVILAEEKSDLEELGQIQNKLLENPGESHLYIELARILSKLGNFEEAELAYRSAEKLGPVDEEFYMAWKMG